MTPILPYADYTFSLRAAPPKIIFDVGNGETMTVEFVNKKIVIPAVRHYAPEQARELADAILDLVAQVEKTGY